MLIQEASGTEGWLTQPPTWVGQLLCCCVSGYNREVPVCGAVWLPHLHPRLKTLQRGKEGEKTRENQENENESFFP